MRKLDIIRKFPRIQWKPVIDAPKGEIVLVLVCDGVDYYTELAYLNEYREWVDIPHLHKVMCWREVPELLKPFLE